MSLSISSSISLVEGKGSLFVGKDILLVVVRKVSSSGRVWDKAFFCTPKIYFPRHRDWMLDPDWSGREVAGNCDTVGDQTTKGSGLDCLEFVASTGRMGVPVSAILS